MGAVAGAKRIASERLANRRLQRQHFRSPADESHRNHKALAPLIRQAPEERGQLG